MAHVTGTERVGLRLTYRSVDHRIIQRNATPYGT